MNLRQKRKSGMIARFCDSPLFACSFRNTAEHGEQCRTAGDQNGIQHVVSYRSFYLDICTVGRIVFGDGPDTCLNNQSRSHGKTTTAIVQTIVF